MSLDNDIKSAFRRHEEDAHTTETAWAEIESKIRRAHQQRGAFASLITITLIAVAAVLVPRLVSTQQNKGSFTRPSGSPTPTSATPTTTPTPVANPIPDGWQRRVGIQDGFQIALPADWKGGWFEGTWDFEPKGLPSDAEGGNTFVVLITLEHGDYAASLVQGTQETEVNGNRAFIWHENATETDYRIEWNFCDGYPPTCSSNFETQTLRVTIRGSTSELWSHFESTGRDIVGTIAAYDGSIPVHGTIAASIPTDDFSRALVRFMDARVEGIGADELMSQTAARFYSNFGGLYDMNGSVAQGYEIAPWTWPHGTPPKHEFEVKIRYADGASRGELITLTRDNPQAVPVVDTTCTACD